MKPLLPTTFFRVPFFDVVALAGGKMGIFIPLEFVFFVAFIRLVYF
jgi:hypothetical protein